MSRSPIIIALTRATRHVQPVKVVLLGYLACILIGWLLLATPFANAGRGVSSLDHLFIAASAVSTTGLATVSPAGTYTLFGELVILLLIQIGGIGYMAMGSFIVLARGRTLSKGGSRLMESDISMPKSFRLDEFVKGVIVFTVAFETVGALALWALFANAGVEHAFYQAVFHSISAFCTAGFSLFDTSLEAFRGNFGVNVVISTLAFLGAVGFIVFVDVWRVLSGQQKELTFTSRIILRLTLLLTIAGTIGVFLSGQDTLAGPPAMRIMEAFFQSMTAMTTVGFNTVPIGALSEGALFLLILLMFVGASPSGTGGGLKTTTISAIWAVMGSVLRGRSVVSFRGRRVPDERVRAATASLAFYAVMLLAGLFVLTLTEAAPFDVLTFEAASALGTVGLSMGVTGNLTALGKIVIILLMFAGRLGPLSFGSALFLRPNQVAIEVVEEDLVV